MFNLIQDGRPANLTDIEQRSGVVVVESCPQLMASVGVGVLAGAPGGGALAPGGLRAGPGLKQRQDSTST